MEAGAIGEVEAAAGAVEEEGRRRGCVGRAGGAHESGERGGGDGSGVEDHNLVAPGAFGLTGNLIQREASDVEDVFTARALDNCCARLVRQVAAARVTRRSMPALPCAHIL